MKRSGQPKPFRTIGSRMRDFGRSMMRHYVPPQELPPSFANEPPPPAWSAAAQTPLVWPEPNAPVSPDFADESLTDTGFVGDQGGQDFTVPPSQPPQRRRPQRPEQPPLPPSVQRKPAPGQPPPPTTSVDQRLKNILAMHQAKEAERDRIREEKKSAFNAAEIQRQTDPDAPPRPRRGRMSVDYIETSTLARGEDLPPPKTPSQPIQRETESPAPPIENAASDEPPISDDTQQLDLSVIQASLDTIRLQRELRGEVAEDFEEDYIPAGDEDAQAFFDSPPDWSEDSSDDDQGTPPPIDVPPAPMPPSGSAQRMPDAPSEPDSGDFSESDAGSWQQETEYPYESGSDANDAPPASDTIVLSPDRAQPAQREFNEYEQPEPDFGGAADFEPITSYDEAPNTEFLNPPTDRAERIQRSEYQSPAPDFTADTGDFEAADARYELPTFDMDEGDTRPVNIQRTPVLPPPDFVDDMTDIPSAETGYNSLADWVDAQSAYSDAPPAPDRPISAQSAERIQRDFEAKANRVAPDFSLQTGDFNQADFEQRERSAATSSDTLDADEGDTRPLDVQRAFHEPDFDGIGDYQSADENQAFGDMGYVNVPESNLNTDIYTQVQRDYQSPDDEQDTQGYIEPADTREFFDEAVYDEPAAPDTDANAEWGGADASQAPADTVQRDYEAPSPNPPFMPYQTDDPADTAIFDVQDDAAASGYENPAGNWGEDAYAPPIADAPHTVQRTYDLPDSEADDEQPMDTADSNYGESRWDGDVNPESVSDTSATVQRDFEAHPVEDAYEQSTDTEWGRDVNVASPADMPNVMQREYDAPADAYNAPQAYENVADDAGEEYGFFAPPGDTPNMMQREYDAPPTYENVADDVDEEHGFFAPPGDMPNVVQRDYEMPADAYDAPQAYENVAEQAGEYEESSEPDAGWIGDVYSSPPADVSNAIQRDYQAPDAPIDDQYAGYEAPSDENLNEYTGETDTPAPDTSNAIQRDYQTAPEPTDESGYAADAEAYQDEADEAAPGWGLESAPRADEPPPSDALWSGDSGSFGATTDAVQRDYQPPNTPDAGGNVDAGYDAGYGDGGEPPMDFYQAMMGAGMIPPDAGWDGGDANFLPPESIQRTPDVHTPNRSVDLFQAMMQTGMVQPEPDAPTAGTYYSPEPDNAMSGDGMSPETKADLLSLLDMPTPRTSAPNVSQTPDSPNTISRVYEPPPQQNPPPVIQRAEDEPDEPQQNDVDVDQLARDVYSVLRNRLRIERERRDRKP